MTRCRNSITWAAGMALLCPAGCALSGNTRWRADRETTTYDCHRTHEVVFIDGTIDDPAWLAAAWTAEFLDIEGVSNRSPRFRTRVKMLWDDGYFYIAAELEEPHVCAELTERDSIVFHDNDFEVFIDPNGDTENYCEVEVNALNTVFDLFLKRTYRNGGAADHDWDFEGLKIATAVDGTINDSSDTDLGWSVEIALPWHTFKAFADRPVPPIHGDRWRVNFSRVQWRYDVKNGRYVKRPGLREDNWVWSPQGVIDMHLPQFWGVVNFVAQ